MFNQVQNLLSSQIRRGTESGDPEEMKAQLKRFLELERERKELPSDGVSERRQISIFPGMKLVQS